MIEPEKNAPGQYGQARRILEGYRGCLEVDSQAGEGSQIAGVDHVIPAHDALVAPLQHETSSTIRQWHIEAPECVETGL